MLPAGGSGTVRASLGWPRDPAFGGAQSQGILRPILNLAADSPWFPGK